MSSTKGIQTEFPCEGPIPSFTGGQPERAVTHEFGHLAAQRRRMRLALLRHRIVRLHVQLKRSYL